MCCSAKTRSRRLHCILSNCAVPPLSRPDPPLPSPSFLPAFPLRIFDDLFKNLYKKEKKEEKREKKKAKKAKENHPMYAHFPQFNLPPIGTSPQCLLAKEDQKEDQRRRKIPDGDRRMMREKRGRGCVGEEWWVEREGEERDGKGMQQVWTCICIPPVSFTPHPTLPSSLLPPLLTSNDHTTPPQLSLLPLLLLSFTPPSSSACFPPSSFARSHNPGRCARFSIADS